MNKHVNKFISVLGLVMVALGAAGCECDKVKDAKKDILEIRDLYNQVIQDRSRWRAACDDLVGLAARIPTHKALLDEKKDDLCKEDFRSAGCEAVRGLSQNLTELRVLTQSACANLFAGGDPSNPDNARGLEMTIYAQKALALIGNKIIPQGTVLIQMACSKDDRFSALMPKGNGQDSRAFDRNSSRIDDLLPVQPSRTGESGPAAAAAI